MTKDELLQKLSEIEWDDFECKRAQDKLPEDVWSTVSAFSNTSGGWIIFGIKQQGTLFEINGVNNGEKTESDFLNTLRNGQKFNMRLTAKGQKYNFDGKFFRYAKLGENAGYGIDKMLVWEKLTKGKVEFASDLVCSTITYWFGDQDSDQPREQTGGQASGHAGEQASDQPSDQPSDQVQKVLNCIRDNVYTMNVLQKKLGISSHMFE